MALDPNIILQGKGVQIDSPFDMYAKAQQIQQNRIALALAGQKQEEYQRSIADANSLRQVVSGFGSDPMQNQQALIKAGRLTEAQAYAKSNADLSKVSADVDHTKAQTGEVQAKTVALAAQQHKDQVGLIADRQSAAAWLQSLYNDPRLKDYVASSGTTVDQAIQRIPSDPAAFADWKMKASLSADKLIEMQETMKSHRANELNAAGQLKVSQGNLGVSQANLGLSRQRLALEQAAPKGQIVQTDSGTMLVDPRTGTAQPVTANGKPLATAKAPTEFQGKSAAFGSRAQEADRLLSDLTGKYSPAAINAKASAEGVPLIGGALGAAANKFSLSDTDQRAEQAQRDFINAVLRQESGAAIGASEFDNARKQYFPQPGDGSGVIAQKARNRKLAVQGLNSNAGKAAFSAPSDDGDVFSKADAILKGK